MKYRRHLFFSLLSITPEKFNGTPSYFCVEKSESKRIELHFNENIKKTKIWV